MTAHTFPRNFLLKLFCSQTERLLVGRHTGGRFDVIEKHSLPELMQRYWCMSKNFEKVHALLTRLVEFVRSHREGKQFAIVHDPEQSAGELHVFAKESHWMCAASDVLKSELMASK